MRRRPGWPCGAPAPIPRRPARCASRRANGWRGSSPGMHPNCRRRCLVSSWNWWRPSNMPICPGAKPTSRMRNQLPDAGALYVRQLKGFAYAVYGSRDYVERTPAAAGEARYRDCSWIGFDDSLAHMPTARWLASKRDGRQPELRCSRAMLVMDGVRAGAGLGVLACVAGDEDPALRRLTPPIAESVRTAALSGGAPGIAGRAAHPRYLVGPRRPAGAAPGAAGRENFARSFKRPGGTQYVSSPLDLMARLRDNPEWIVSTPTA